MSQNSKRKRDYTTKVDFNNSDETVSALSSAPDSLEVVIDNSASISDTLSSPSSKETKPSSSKRSRNEETLDNGRVELPALNTHNLAPHSPPLSSPPVFNYHINPPPVGRPIRIYSDGIFDLFHFGHARMLEQAKKAFENVHLIVGVCDDATTHSKKGKTVLNEFERAESLRHCKWVDQVVEHAPWVIDQEFIDKYQIDYVAHDDIPYASTDSSDVYAFVKEQGKFWPTSRTEGVSTSDLITRIVRDYHQYVRRNLERGVTAKELNLGFLKEQEMNVKKSISEIKTSIHQNWHGTRTELENDFSELKNDLRQTFAVWEERSQEFVRGFSGMFGAESVVDKLRRKLRRSSSDEGNGDEDSNHSGNTTTPEEAVSLDRN